jgi:hypothetical protein
MSSTHVDTHKTYFCEVDGWEERTRISRGFTRGFAELILGDGVFNAPAREVCRTRDRICAAERQITSDLSVSDSN